MAKALRILVCALATALTISAHAQAEPLRILSGSWGADFESPSMLIRGSAFTVGLDPFVGFARIAGFNEQPRFFSPGDVYTLAAQSPGDVLFGTGHATIGGTTFTDVTLRGTFTFSAPDLIVPDFGTENAPRLLRSPFTYRGTMNGLSSTGEPLFSLDLFGNGSAALAIDINFIPYSRDRIAVGYGFTDAAPVPEPATMFLIGTGLAGLAAARRRARHAHN